MGNVSKLYVSRVPVNDNIYAVIPTVGEIIENEEEFYNVLSLFVSTPYDFMVVLEDEFGVDFTSINDFQLFLILFESIKQHNTKLLFGDLDFNKFVIAKNDDDNSFILVDVDDNIVIDEAVFMRMAEALREIHGLQRNNKKPANEESKNYLLEKERKRLKRAKRKKKSKSELEYLIIALVNTEQFKYNYEQVKDLSIYQFNVSVRQILHKINFNYRMIGVYAGTVDSKTLSSQDLSWIMFDK